MNAFHEEEDDAVLVAKVLAGNRQAFRPLADRYQESVLRFCIRLLGDPVEAQDIAQEALLQAFLGLDRLQQPARFGAWLHAIAGHLARSSIRRQRPMPLEGLEETGHARLQHLERFPSPEQVVTMRETHDAILAALRELSLVNLEAVIGYYLQDYSYADLAGLLGVPISTVKSRLFKGRQQLRQHLGHLIERTETPMTSAESTSFHVEMICEYALTQRSIIVLGALSGNRYLPIRVLTEEAVAVERALKRPLDAPPVVSQDTMLQLIATLGARIEHVLLRSLSKQNYYASLILRQDGNRHEMDCRLSDALVLAIRAQIPVQIEPALLDEAGLVIEPMSGEPARAEAELPAPLEPATVSDQWPRTFVEQVWSFLVDVLLKHRTPHDLSSLRTLPWEKIFPAREVDWEGQTMLAVRLPDSEPAWLVVHPELWGQLRRFVEWVQHREIPPPVASPAAFVPLSAEQQDQVQELLEQAWFTLIDLGARSLALLHLDGHIVSWKGLDGYDTAHRMGHAALKDFILGRSLAALVDATAEPAIKVTYEQNTAFNPSLAAGSHGVSTSEALIHTSWLLVIGWTTDPQNQEIQSELERIQQSLALLLPG